MDSGTAKVVEIIGLVILVLTVVMFISVVVMLATGANFVPIMAAPLVFFGVGMAVLRAGRKSARRL